MVISSRQTNAIVVIVANMLRDGVTCVYLTKSFGTCISGTGIGSISNLILKTAFVGHHSIIIKSKKYCNKKLSL